MLKTKPNEIEILNHPQAPCEAPETAEGLRRGLWQAWLRSLLLFCSVSVYVELCLHLCVYHSLDRRVVYLILFGLLGGVVCSLLTSYLPKILRQIVGTLLITAQVLFAEVQLVYRSATQVCKDCPCRSVCGANENGQRMLTTHIWQEFLDLVEQLRKTERGKEIYAMRKQTIERVFADAKEKHAMRYTHHRGLARVSAWVRLKYAAMNLKKLALWKWSRSDFFVFLPYFFFDTTKTPALA